jgi:hypothetical protein
MSPPDYVRMAPDTLVGQAAESGARAGGVAVTALARLTEAVSGPVLPPLATLVAISFLYPILACALFFPTPHSDLREQINWGLSFPLYTMDHPPLQSWIAGLIARTGARDAWSYVLAAQILNAVGVCYLARTAYRYIGGTSAAALIVAICGSIYFVAGVVTRALNADDLMFFSWYAALYHALRAVEDDRWRDWLALGCFAALSLLAKYTSIVFLISLAVAGMWILGPKRLLSNPRFHVSATICAVMFFPLILPTLQHSGSLRNAVHRFRPDATVLFRLEMVLKYLGATLVVFYPYAVGLGVAALRGETRVEAPGTRAQRIILVTALISNAATALLIVAGGLEFILRYITPFFGITVLALLCAIRLTPNGLRTCAYLAIGAWLVMLPCTGVYVSVFVNEKLREPAPEAARLVGIAWDLQFSCGPAYIIGPSAYVVALYFKRPVAGLSIFDFFLADGVDKGVLSRSGAIVIGTPRTTAEMVPGVFSTRTPAVTISLPYRRSFSRQRHEYTYYFVPPSGC